jgi:hypothetical protein
MKISIAVELGKPFELLMEAKNGKFSFKFNGKSVPSVTFNSEYAGNYWKIGSYLQGGIVKGNVSTVSIYALDVIG